MNNLLQIKAIDLRLHILDIVMAGQCGHIGGDFSVVDMLDALYERMHVSPERANDPGRDRFILSKGHCVEALYAVLSDRGFLNLEDILATYSKFGSDYIGHPHNHLPGIEMNSGSLGHGLAVCVGMALAGRMDRRDYRVYTVMGDGELAEGSVWEAAMAAGHFKLDRLCALVDRNRLQISGGTEEIMAQDDLAARFGAFGWRVLTVADGNDPAQLRAALDEAERTEGRPCLLIAETVKGCGASIMENKAAWHHKVPSREEYEQIRGELLARKEALSRE